MAPIDERAAAIACRQYGLITRRQALEAGISADAIHTRRTTMRWLTVESGVYMINGATPTWHSRLLAPCLAFDGYASHRSVGALLGLDGYRQDLVELSIPRGRMVKREDIVLHESTDLDRFEPVLLDRIPCTPPTRLAVDLGSVVSFFRYDRTIAEMIRRGMLTWDDLFREIVVHSRRGRNGVGVARRLHELRRGIEVGDSFLEDTFLRALRRWGLPEPVAQLKIYDADGVFIARVDFAYPDRRIAIEVDSLGHHDDPMFESDRLKRDRLTAEGWAVQEVTRKMLVHDARNVFRRIERLLDRPVWPEPTISPFSGGRWPTKD